MTTAQITSLTIYPVKSMKGISLESAVLTPLGLENDRRFMVVRSNGRFVTQRDLARLALVNTSLAEDGIVLSMDGHGSVMVPFKTVGGEPVLTRVWGDACETVSEGEEISRWLSAALDSTGGLKLVRMAPGFIRPQGKPQFLGPATTTQFADAAPYLVANESSLQELNRVLRERMLDPVPMNRFRPNIVIQGPGPFAEHEIAGLASDAYSLEFCHPCERCVVTTIDQDTGIRNPDRQPFKTLAEINPMPDNRAAPAFAQNAVLGRGDGQPVAIGDKLQTL